MNTEQRDFALMLKQHILTHNDKVTMSYFKFEITEQFKINNSLAKELTCGTVGCIAGTAAYLANGKWDTWDSEETARELLGLDVQEGEALFYFPFENQRNPLHEVYAEEKAAITPLLPGTREYAKIVAQALQKCIDRNYKE